MRIGLIVAPVVRFSVTHPAFVTTHSGSINAPLHRHPGVEIYTYPPTSRIPTPLPLPIRGPHAHGARVSVDPDALSVIGGSLFVCTFAVALTCGLLMDCVLDMAVEVPPYGTPSAVDAVGFLAELYGVGVASVAARATGWVITHPIPMAIIPITQYRVYFSMFWCMTTPELICYYYPSIVCSLNVRQFWRYLPNNITLFPYDHAKRNLPPHILNQIDIHIFWHVTRCICSGNSTR